MTHASATPCPVLRQTVSGAIRECARVESERGSGGTERSAKQSMWVACFKKSNTRIRAVSRVVLKARVSREHCASRELDR
eukprot:1169269-Rhodomonas_salina.1